MSKRPRAIDRNPFIPTRSPICRTADAVLLFCVPLAGLVAALAIVFQRVM